MKRNREEAFGTTNDVEISNTKLAKGLQQNL